MAVVVAISWIAGEEVKPSIEQPPLATQTGDAEVKPFQPPAPDLPRPHISANLIDLDDGEFECIVKNETRSEGPYTLTCEKESDEITIHFQDGGFIVTDTNGFYASSGDQWSIEVDK